jgi:hypothetical protein
MWGGAIATAVTFGLMFAVSAVWTYRMQPYSVEGVRLLKMGIVLGGITAVYYAVPVKSLAAQVGWSALLLAMFPAGLLLLKFPTPGEMEAVRRVFAVPRWLERRSSSSRLLTSEN